MLTAAAPYTEAFYSKMHEWADESARQSVPYLLNLICPSSIVDVGCGDGSWLRVFMDNGVHDLVGIDGDYVDQSTLAIPSEKFYSYDLSTGTLPKLPRCNYDLVISLEVAEHLPAHAAQEFVGCLTRLGSVVLFSAAVPFQGGTSHVNEQWPEYWSDLFHRYGYVPLDCFRHCFWNNEAVSWFYRQNALIFVNPHSNNLADGVRAALLETTLPPRSLIHPECFLSHVRQMQELAGEINEPTLGYLLSHFVGALRRSIGKRTGFSRREKNSNNMNIDRYYRREQSG